jgi:hypothetical protein
MLKHLMSCAFIGSLIKVGSYFAQRRFVVLFGSYPCQDGKLPLDDTGPILSPTSGRLLRVLLVLLCIIFVEGIAVDGVMSPEDLSHYPRWLLAISSLAALVYIVSFFGLFWRRIWSAELFVLVNLIFLDVSLVVPLPVNHSAFRDAVDVFGNAVEGALVLFLAFALVRAKKT